MATGKFNNAISITVAVVAPPILMLLYLTLSRWPVRWFADWTDWIAIGVCLSVGSVLIWRLPYRESVLAVSLLVFAPAMLVALVYLSLKFVCAAFGDCL